MRTQPVSRRRFELTRAVAIHYLASWIVGLAFALRTVDGLPFDVGVSALFGIFALPLDLGELWQSYGAYRTELGSRAP